MYTFYIIVHIFVGTAAPLFFAVMLPLSTVSTLMFVGTWQNFAVSLKHPVFKISAIIVVMLLVSCIYSSFPSHSLKDAAQLSLLLICFAVLWGLKTNINNKLTEQHKKIIFYVLVTALISILGLNILVQQRWLSWEVYFFNRTLAALSLCFWSLSLYYNDKKDQWWLWLAYILILVNIVVGVSETAFLICIASSLTYLFFSIISGPSSARTSVFALGIVLISSVPSLLAYIKSTSIIHYLTSLIGPKLHHYKIWVTSFDNAIQNFPLGAGINTTQRFNTEAAIAERGFSIHHPHNLQIELFSELGIIGIFISILLIFAAVRLFQKAPRSYQPAIAATLVAIFVFYAVSFSIWQEWRNGLVAFVLIVTQRFLSEQISQK